MLLGAMGVLACALGCAEGDPSGADDVSAGSTPTKVAADDSGSISFALTTPDGAHFETFDYVITGPDFARSGHVTVSKSNTVSALIDGLPAAAGYTMTLMGASTPPDQVTCSGSAGFSIAAGAVTSVPLSVACHVAAPAAAPVPLPRSAPLALGFVLLAIGALAVGRKRERSA